MRLAMVLTTLVGCSSSPTGPEPGLSGVSPTVVCAGREAQLAVKGRGMAALNADSLAQGRLVLPQLTLTRVQDLQFGMASEIVPAADYEVTWIDQMNMGIRLCPTSACGMMAGGVHSLLVQNPAGGSAQLPSAFGVLPPSRVDAAEQAFFCAAEDDQIVLRGEFYRIDGVDGVGTSPAALGTLPAGASPADCRALPGPGTVKIELCTRVRVDIRANTLTPGLHPFSFQGPSPIDCPAITSTSLTGRGAGQPGCL